MSDLRVTETSNARPPDFNLNAYAARSFGSFQEEPFDVVLRFAPEVVDEVAAFQFQPSQTMTHEADGSTVVHLDQPRARAGLQLPRRPV